MSIDHENGIKTPNGKIYKKMDIQLEENYENFIN